MARIAPTIHTDQADIARIEALIVDLPSGERVALTLSDGSVTQGIVAERPSLQLFYDAAGNEGFNARLRLEDPALDPRNAGVRDYWLDRVTAVQHLLPQ